MSVSCICLLVIFCLFQQRIDGTTIYTCNATSPCGCSKNSAIVSKIVGGEAAKTSSWGWMVSLRERNQHICGGAILSASYVITAAHCMDDLGSLSVGTIVAGIDTQSQAGIVRSLTKSYVHPQYDPVTFENDIAIIQLKTPLDMTNLLISKICLPTIDPNLLKTQDYPIVGSTLVGIGWGTLSAGSLTLSDTLQQVTVKAISKTAATCRSVLENSTLQFCAGVTGGGKDTCQGDSGGPLMMFTSSHQWELVGITSYGIGCGLPDFSGVYTKVAYYQSWIRAILGTTTTTKTTKPTTKTTTTVKPTTKTTMTTAKPTTKTTTTVKPTTKTTMTTAKPTTKTTKK
ncbi:unnamed protein product [Didymodactylos carnosus]|uniref:Peptidase S1 domain-containing protein n=1 Tax=Didymodactylos carnosus TaxID=1234261 RepID=A0A8S2DPG1_9BILA|nr:unnamed protein product [Didymodactylos carnosus]CAF3766412.1 unnamed protein product [Didymodactylos carnosus]